MLMRDNYTEEHISEVRAKTGVDPSVLERTIFAFGLLEAIRQVELPFIFKGGTSLLLLLETPRRLSTDIDIIVDPGTEIDRYIQEAGQIFPFRSVEENIRKGSNNVEKRHFRFLFVSPRNGREINILLDVVFEKNPYRRLIEKPIISNSILLTEGNDLTVQLPDKNCILGDKLVAFAPRTTGIPFGKDKELEIIKQMFDCWSLLHEMDDYQLVTEVYRDVARIEMDYRGLTGTFDMVLLDTIKSCICIIGRNAIRPEDYQNFVSGINAIQGHIIQYRMNGENAALIACEIMYLAACILTKQADFERITDPIPFRARELTMRGSKRVRYLRNVDPAAYAYLTEAFRLLQQEGYYIESIL